MASDEKDLYFVAVKVLLRDGNKLLITHDIFGDWDIPGGRLKKSEFDTPLEVVVKRKMSEELGGNLQYELGKPVVFFRHERQEQSLSGQTTRIFAVGFEGKYISGEPKLGDHHDKLEWVDIETFKPEDYFAGGWLKGVKEYLLIHHTELN